jgi:DNA-binding Lrp family transcriptional regulator
MPEELDLLDRKLIYALDFNARMPLSVLAKKLRVSKQVAKYRIDGLLRRGVIRGFYTDINASKLGLEIYMVYFKFRGMAPEVEKAFMEHMRSQEGVGVNISVNGKWDYTIDVWAESIMHFKRIYQRIMKDYERYVKEKQVVIETDFYYFKPKQMLDGEPDGHEQITMTGDIEKMELDGTDRKILSVLSRNSRVPLVELGKATGLTPGAVKKRVRSLEKSGIILGYRVFIDYQLLGFLHYRVFLHMENFTDDVERRVIGFLKRHRACVSVTKTIGYCELEFRPVVRSVGEFYGLMDELRREFSDYLKEYESIIYYKMHDVWNYFPFKG